MFTKEQQDLIMSNYKYVDEILVDSRKGVPQSKYVLYFPETCGELEGYWMMRYAMGLDCMSEEDALSEEPWVRCEKKEVVISKWVSID